MDKDDIIRCVNQPGMISGIYNYCDRWCERCPFTTRCANFALGQEQFCDPQDRDMRNQQFWDKMHEMFRVTLEMLQENAEQMGLDWQNLDLEDAKEATARRFESVQKHPLVSTARAYYPRVDQWFESNQAVFTAKAEELTLHTGLALPNCDPEKEAASIKDATEVIGWYQHQIYVKLTRSVGGCSQDGDEPRNDDCPEGVLGSAKVALLGMDRSIAAWGLLLQHFPQQEGEILTLLVCLERLRRNAEHVFPKARAFVRPGFDE